MFHCWVGVSFAVHPDLKIHTGTFMSLSKLAVTDMPKKQNIDTRSSNKVGLVGLDDTIYHT